MQKRVARNLLAKVGTQTAQFFAYVQDLAQQGLGMTCNRKLDQGTEVEVQLNVPGHATMNLKGKVAWRRDLPVISKNRYQIGVALADPDPQYVTYVEALIKRDYERRKEVRFSDVLEVKSEDVLDLLDTAVADVSAGGLYVRTGKPLTVGKQFELALVGKGLPKPLYCLGEVVAVFECDPDNLDHPFGAGIRIVSFVGGDGKLFADYIRSLEDLYKFHWPEDIPTS